MHKQSLYRKFTVMVQINSYFTAPVWINVYFLWQWCGLTVSFYRHAVKFTEMVLITSYGTANFWINSSYIYSV